MERVFGILAASAVVAFAAAPAWAHHYHYGHYHHGYYGHYYSSSCDYYITQGDAYYDQGNVDMAIADYTQAIANDPRCALAFAQRCAAWDEKGEYDKGIADANQALAIDPSYAEALVSRSALWFNKGEYDKSIADANQALAINPSLAQAYANRGSSWNMKGEYEKAVADFNQAIAIDGNNAEVLDELAFLQATCLDEHFRNAQKAFENANRAYQLANGSSASVSVLASAYAENGDFAKAQEWQAKAVELTNSAEMKQRYLARVELFKQGKPFRFDPKTAMQMPAVGVAKTTN